MPDVNPPAACGFLQNGHGFKGLADFSDWQAYRLLHLAMPGPQRAEQPEAFHGAPFPPYRQKNRTLPSFGLRVSLFSDSPMQIRRQTANRSHACRQKGEGEDRGSPCVAGRSRPTCGKRDKEQGTAWPPGQEVPVAALPWWALSKFMEGITASSGVTGMSCRAPEPAMLAVAAIQGSRKIIHKASCEKSVPTAWPTPQGRTHACRSAQPRGSLLSSSRRMRWAAPSRSSY